MIKCSNCGNEIKEGTKFCSKCGNNILEQQEKNRDENPNDEKQSVKKCSNCGNELGEGTVFCPKCGSKVTEDNDEQHFSKTSQQNTDGVSKEEYQYTRPEKVRFSERWLLLKLFVISLFLSNITGDMFTSLAEMDYTGALGLLLACCLLAYWLYRNYKNYAGNPYMLKFEMKDETIIKVSKTIKIIYKVVDFIIVVVWIVKGITYIGDTGLFSLMTWVVLPATSVGSWVALSVLLVEVDYIILAHRPYQWAVDRGVNIEEIEE